MKVSQGLITLVQVVGFGITEVQVKDTMGYGF